MPIQTSFVTVVPGQSTLHDAYLACVSAVKRPPTQPVTLVAPAESPRSNPETPSRSCTSGRRCRGRRRITGDGDGLGGRRSRQHAAADTHHSQYDHQTTHRLPSPQLPLHHPRRHGEQRAARQHERQEGSRCRRGGSPSALSSADLVLGTSGPRRTDEAGCAAAASLAAAAFRLAAAARLMRSWRRRRCGRRAPAFSAPPRPGLRGPLSSARSGYRQARSARDWTWPAPARSVRDAGPAGSPDVGATGCTGAGCAGAVGAAPGAGSGVTGGGRRRGIGLLSSRARGAREHERERGQRDDTEGGPQARRP